MRLICLPILLGLGVSGGAAQVPDDRLSFQPSQPEAGDVVTVHYEPLDALAGEATLVLRTRLRARLRTRFDEPGDEGLESRLRLTNSGWSLALRLGETDAIRLWVGRYVA